MTPMLFRLGLAASCVAAALLAVCLIQQNLTGSRQLKDYQRLTGFNGGYAEDGSYLVDVPVPGEAAGSFMVHQLDRRFNPDPNDGQLPERIPVVLYLDPSGYLPPLLGDPAHDNARPPLPAGSYDRRWLSTTILALVAIGLLAVAAFILLIPVLPNGWNWGSPAPWEPLPGAIAARWNSRFSLLIFAGLGLLPIIAAIVQQLVMGETSRAGWVWSAGGWLVFVSILTLAQHAKSYRIWPDDSGLRESSLLGWKETRWSDIRFIQDRTERVQDASSNFLDDGTSQRGINDTQLHTHLTHYVVLLGGQGQILVRLASELVGQKGLVRSCAEHTGLPVEIRPYDPDDKRVSRFFGERIR